MRQQDIHALSHSPSMAAGKTEKGPSVDNRSPKLDE